MPRISSPCSSTWSFTVSTRNVYLPSSSFTSSPGRSTWPVFSVISPVTVSASQPVRIPVMSSRSDRATFPEICQRLKSPVTTGISSSASMTPTMASARSCRVTTPSIPPYSSSTTASLQWACFISVRALSAFTVSGTKSAGLREAMTICRSGAFIRKKSFVSSTPRISSSSPRTG